MMNKYLIEHKCNKSNSGFQMVYATSKYNAIKIFEEVSKQDKLDDIEQVVSCQYRGPTFLPLYVSNFVYGTVPRCMYTIL